MSHAFLKWIASGLFQVHLFQVTKKFQQNSRNSRAGGHQDVWNQIFQSPKHVSQRYDRSPLRLSSLSKYKIALDWKYNNNDKRIAMTSMMLFWCLYCQLWTHFTPFSNVSLVDFEQAHVCWIIFENNLKPNMNILSIKLLQINTMVLFPRANNCDMSAINFDLASISSRVPNLKIIATTYSICSRT